MFEVDGSMALIQVMDRFPPDEDALKAAVDQERIPALEPETTGIRDHLGSTRPAPKLVEDGDLIVNLEAAQAGR